MTPLVVFGFTPTELEVTTIVIVQPAAGKLGTVKLRAVAPARSAGLFVTPTQDPPIVVDATLMFTSVSVKLAFVSALAFGLVSVNVIVDVPPDRIVARLNAFAIVGLPMTVRSTEGDGLPTVV